QLWQVFLQGRLATSQDDMARTERNNLFGDGLRCERAPCAALAHTPRIFRIAPGTAEVTGEEAYKSCRHTHQRPFTLNRAVDFHDQHCYSSPARSAAVIST